jgi:superfamily II DNA or RNA helicase
MTAAPGKLLAQLRPELRPYQRLAVYHLARRLAVAPRRGVLALPTGSGKTRIAGELARSSRHLPEGLA